MQRRGMLGGSSRCSWSLSGQKPMSQAKVAKGRQTERVGKRRHEIERAFGGAESFSAPSQLRCHVNGFADAGVGSAAAEIACHGVVYVFIRRVCVHREQRRSAHYLPRLAIAALRNLNPKPRSLHGV